MAAMLEAIARQDVALPLEVIVVDGLSDDGTVERIGDFADRHPEIAVTVIPNPARVVPDAMNLGIEAALGEVIVRMDAHALPSDDYVRRCLTLLEQPGVAVVGMPWRIRSSSPARIARAIAAAAGHPFGIGDARYRLGADTAQDVDTVPFGVFRKTLWRQMGGFDTALPANQDYEFNYRARVAGGRVVLGTEAHCVYFPRTTLRALARQNYRYGHWKAQMLKANPRALRARQLAAPALVAHTAGLGLLATRSPRARRAWLLGLGLYGAAAATSAGRVARRTGDRGLVPAILAAFACIHGSWGAGFLLGLLPRRGRHP